MPTGPPLRKSFYARDSRVVARALIGCRIVHRLDSGERLTLRLVEVEAYLGDGTDAASHAHRGPTPRNAVMFGPAGRLYAYRSYGIHTCVNVVCADSGRAAAVLLRAGEPIGGLDTMRRLRGLPADAPAREIARGPGRLAQALGLRIEDDGANLLRGRLTLHGPPAGEAACRVESGPRVGITLDAELPYRFLERESEWASPFRPGKPRRRKR